MEEVIKLNAVDQYNKMFGLETLHPLVSVVDLSEATGPGDRGQHAGRYAAQRLRPAVPPRLDKRHLAGTGNKAVFLLFLFLYRGTAFVRRRERNLPRLSEED